MLNDESSTRHQHGHPLWAPGPVKTYTREEIDAYVRERPAAPSAPRPSAFCGTLDDDLVDGEMADDAGIEGALLDDAEPRVPAGRSLP